jgi:hypothetical protein
MESRFMNASRLSLFGAILLVLGISPTLAQESAPIVDYEIIGSQPFRSPDAAAVVPGSISPESAAAVSDLATAEPAPVVIAIEAADPSSNAATPASIVGDHPRWADWFGTIAGGWIAQQFRSNLPPPPLGVPAMNLTERGTLLAGPPVPSADATSAGPLDAQLGSPAPLSSTESQLFSSSRGAALAAPLVDAPVRSVRPPAPRMPKMSKMFSFDTTDKGASGGVTTALGSEASRITLNLAGPNWVSVNQVFHQLVQVRNSSDSPLYDVRVTQVCDLTVLGAEQAQAVTIDCLNPGETKTVRFSARANQPGPFPVRYIAENERIQVDADELVEVGENNLRLQLDGPTVMQVSDGATIVATIHNSTPETWDAVELCCSVNPVLRVTPLGGIQPRDVGDGSERFSLPALEPGQSESIRLRVVPAVPGPAKLVISLESAGRLVAAADLDIEVLARPQ